MSKNSDYNVFKLVLAENLKTDGLLRL